MNVRERTEEIEKSILSPFATLAANTKGRMQKHEPCDIRTEFQRDRDKIIHSKAFRRLKHKTQVFISPEGDHYRTRLTHTLEVAQIARTISRSLRLNEDLTEAMALGHDIGHTPFGHAGEKALNEVCPFGFKHYEQSLRVVDFLENDTGLNLTYEVRDGILNHAGAMQAQTLEGIVLKFADRIAYINHDIDDALRGDIIKETDIPKECVSILGDNHSKRIDTMINDIIENSDGKPHICMSDEVLVSMNMLRDFMFQHVYMIPSAMVEEEKVKYVVKRLYEYFADNPDQILSPGIRNEEGFEKERLVADYIAGMTDRYAIYLYKQLFLPKAWYKHQE